MKSVNGEKQYTAWFVACEIRRPTGERHQVNYLVSALTKLGARRAAAKKVRRGNEGVVCEPIVVYPLHSVVVALSSEWPKV